MVQGGGEGVCKELDRRIGLVRASDPAGWKRITVREWEEIVREDVRLRQAERERNRDSLSWR